MEPAVTAAEAISGNTTTTLPSQTTSTINPDPTPTLGSVLDPDFPLKITYLKDNDVWFEPGRYVLDGPLTLGYARNRKTEGGDFDRATRQQQVAIAIRNQILRLDMIPTILAKAPILYNELVSGITTNLTLEQMIALGMLALEVPQENIARGVIGPPDMVTLEKPFAGDFPLPMHSAMARGRKKPYPLRPN